MSLEEKRNVFLCSDFESKRRKENRWTFIDFNFRFDLFGNFPLFMESTSSDQQKKVSLETIRNFRVYDLQVRVFFLFSFGENNFFPSVSGVARIRSTTEIGKQKGALRSVLHSGQWKMVKSIVQQNQTNRNDEKNVRAKFDFQQEFFSIQRNADRRAERTVDESRPIQDDSFY